MIANRMYRHVHQSSIIAKQCTVWDVIGVGPGLLFAGKITDDDVRCNYQSLMILTCSSV